MNKDQESSAHKYRAFISYSSADKKWAKWLHKSLESYRMPSPLVGTTNKDGEKIKKRLGVFFRDRDELSSSSNLSQALLSALKDSENLIIICSPNSVKSTYVNEEIKEFKKLGKGERIHALIIDGTPHASNNLETKDQECFPDALLYKLDKQGELSFQPDNELLAADIQKQGDGKRNAILKLIAGMLKVDFDQLKQRDKKRQRQLIIMWFFVIATVLAGTGYFINEANKDTKEQIELKNKGVAESLFRPFDDDPVLTDEEMRTLWDMTTHQANDNQKILRLFVREATRNQEHLIRLEAHAAAIVRALVGLNPARRKAFIEEVPWGGLSDEVTFETIGALSSLVWTLEVGGKESKILADTIMLAIEKAGDKENPGFRNVVIDKRHVSFTVEDAIISEFGWSGQYLDEEYVSRIINMLLKNLENKTGDTRLYFDIIASMSPSLNEQQTTRILALASVESWYLHKTALKELINILDHSSTLAESIATQTVSNDYLRVLVERFSNLDASETDVNKVADALLLLIPQQEDPKSLLHLVQKLKLKQPKRSNLAESLFQYDKKHSAESWKDTPSFVETILHLDATGYKTKLASALMLRLQNHPPKYNSGNGGNVAVATNSLLQVISDSQTETVIKDFKNSPDINISAYMVSLPELLSPNQVFRIAKTLVPKTPSNGFSESDKFYPSLRQISNENARELADLIISRFEAGKHEYGGDLAPTFKILAPKLAEPVELKHGLAERCLVLLEDKARSHLKKTLLYLGLSVTQKERALVIYGKVLTEQGNAKDRFFRPSIIDDIAALDPPKNSKVAARALAAAIEHYDDERAWKDETEAVSVTKLNPTSDEILNASKAVLDAMKRAIFNDHHPAYARALLTLGADPNQLAMGIQILFDKLKNNPDLDTITAINILGSQRMLEAIQMSVNTDIGNLSDDKIFTGYTKFSTDLTESEQITLSSSLRRGLSVPYIKRGLDHDDVITKNIVDFLISLDKLPLSNLLGFLKLPTVSGVRENPVLVAVQKRITEKWPLTSGDALAFENSPWKMLEWMNNNQAFIRDQFQINNINSFFLTPPLPIRAELPEKLDLN